MRILVVKMSSMGDLFHALPAVHLLKEKLQARVDWVAHDLYVELARCFTDVERVIAYPRGNFIQKFAAFRDELRRESYDYVFDFQGLLKSGFVTWMARARRRVGPSFHREGSRVFYDIVAGARNKNRHAVDECLDAARVLGIPPGGAVFPVNFPAYSIPPHFPRVAMLPCSRRRDKNWPVARFIEVGQALVKQRGAAIYLLGSGADAGACEHIASQLSGRIYNMAGKTSIVQLGGLLKEMDLLVTVDSGPMHMAAAVNTPVVAVFGPTYPERTGPFGAQHRVIKEGDSLKALPSAPVIRAALERLN